MLRKYLRKKRVVLIIVIIVIILGWSLYEWLQPTALPASLPVLVKVAPATEQSLPLTVTALGNLIAPQGTMLKSQQAGVIQSILFKNGQNVTEGQLLLQLNAQSQQAAFDQAQAALVNAKSLYDRYMSLQKEDADVLSQMQIDQQYATYQEALATLAGMKKSLEDMQIRAPFSGTVDYRAPLVSASSHSFTVRAKLLNPQGLSPGMLMHVTHILEAARQVLAVPTLSLVSELSGFGVYEVVNHKVVEQFVTIGVQYNDQTEIVSGLTPGAEVIVAGQEKVEPGQLVTVSHS